MIKNFAIENYNSSTSQYQPNQLKQINACLLSQMNYTQISNILVKEQSNILLTPNMWEIIKNNVSNFDDIKMWNHILYNQPNITNKLSQDDKTYLNKILSFLPENIIQGSWKQWTQTINQNLQIKGKKLFLPIRIALTGLTHGPPMEDIILLLGKEQVQKRIKKCLN